MPHLECVRAVMVHDKTEDCRTSPYRMTCLDDDAKERQFVVKLHSQLNAGILSELWCARLGHKLQLPFTTTAIVEVDERLSAVSPDFANALRLPGPHFGSELIGEGLTPFDGSSTIPRDHFGVAIEIFAFDCLVRNPDRCKSNPNLYFNNNRFWMIDHELALNFASPFDKGSAPWEIALGNPEFTNHVMYKQLKRRVSADQIEGFVAKVSDITLEDIKQIAESMPPTWNHPEYNALIVKYFQKVMAELPRYQRHILEVLA